MDISGQKVTLTCESIDDVYHQALAQLTPIKELCSKQAEMLKAQENLGLNASK